LALPDLAAAPEAFAASVVRRLSAGQPVRRAVPGGWLHIDRPLPFVCVHRAPPREAVPSAERLVLSQASHLAVSGDPGLAAAVRHLLTGVGRALAERFGEFLVLELWVDARADTFRVYAPSSDPPTTAAALADALKGLEVLGRPAIVETIGTDEPGPPELEALLTPDQQRQAGVLLLGLEVPGVFLDADGTAFPGVLRRLQHDLTPVLQQAVFEFTTVQTNFRPEDYRSFGPRRLLNATREADRRLARIAGQVDYLVAVTPVNSEAAWAEFRDSGFARPPALHYRPLSVDPDLLKRALYAVPLERVEDPTLAGIFRAKRQELDRQISMLEDRNSEAFLPTSMQLYGTVGEDLLSLAEALLARVQQRRQDCDGPSEPAACLDAAGFAELATAELGHYRAVESAVTATVRIREDIPGVLVSGGNLLVGAQVKIPYARADALVQHEVGTHIVTHVNGAAQPLRLLRVGLPGYEETQEGLAVLAEYVAGGLTPARLATLAARVVAVHRLVAGVPFADTFAELRDRFGLTGPQAFRVTVRVYRAGGLTKDAVYLRGLHHLLRYLADGHPLDPLLVGKLSLGYVPVVQELGWREVLSPPLLQPRWLSAPSSQPRLEAIRSGLSLLDLLPEAST
jgi:uncharacterized protein (TIGR02421 family)